MTTTAWLLDRAGADITDETRIDFAEDFAILVELAKGAGQAVCICWASPGSAGYWGPNGSQDKPHWYGTGRPALAPGEKLVVMPVRVTEGQRAKFRGLEDGPERLRRWLDRIK